MRFLFSVLLLVITVGRVHGANDALDAIDRAVHGVLADDIDYVREVEMPVMEMSPPPDVPESSPWDLEEHEIAVQNAEKVDEWEAVPLPAEHYEEQLVRDSEAIAPAGSEARRELEEEMAQAVEALGQVRPPVDSDEIVELPSMGRVDAKIIVDDIYIFSTDDFDGEESDVEGDSPIAPKWR